LLYKDDEELSDSIKLIKIMENTEATDINFTELTAHVVSAYVANNALHRSDLPSVIETVHMALQGLANPKAQEPAKPQPAVSIRKSVTPSAIISLEDGKPYKSLKRHLTRLGMTPAEYREKWGLPKDYPMVSPDYAKQRSELAKSIGLGQSRRKAIPAPVVPEKPKRVAAPKRKAAGAK
jgi:predicted transcriptional regulator